MKVFRVLLMKTFRMLLVASFVLIVPGWTVSADTMNGVPRFQQVGNGFFRGGQPTTKGFQELKAAGIKTVINFRVEDTERELVESLGMKYIHIPVDMPVLSRPWKKIDAADIDAFFRAIEDRANEPVFVHCQRGADRTGMFVGLYRIAYEKWDGARAYREARQIGMRWWYRSFKNQLLNYRPAAKAVEAVSQGI